MYVTLTATQSRAKPCDESPAMSVRRTLKLASASSAGVHARPQVSVPDPKRKVVTPLPRTDVERGVPHDVPPSHDSSTQILGLLAELFALASRRTSMPLMVAPVEMATP